MARVRLTEQARSELLAVLAYYESVGAVEYAVVFEERLLANLKRLEQFHHKGTIWEGGIRVPAIVRWPGRIPAGKVSGQVGITMDLTATILAATGTAVPDAARLEGIDLLPVFEGRVPEIERTLFWRVVGTGPQQAVRSGEWKLVMDGGRALLFNLRSDVSERNNLTGERSDIARRLRSLLVAWQMDVDSEAKAVTSR